MDKTRLGPQITQWAKDVPRLLAQIAEAGEMPRLTDAQKTDLDVMAARITELFSKVSAMANGDENNETFHKLLSTANQLHNEIAIANAVLGKLLQESAGD